MKKLVQDVMTPKERLIIVTQTATIRKVLKTLQEKNVKSVIVEKNSQNGAYGLLTYKNILQSIIAEDGDIDLLNAYDIMISPTISVSRKLDVKYAAKMMVNSSIKRLLVIDDNEIYGILTMTDIIEVLMESIDS